MRTLIGAVSLVVGLGLTALTTSADASPLSWHIAVAALALFCIGTAGFLLLIEAPR